MKVTICRNGRTFNAYVSSIGFHMAEISFYEVVRPSWKIFRTKFFPFHSATIFVEDYDSIIEAVEKKCLKVFALRRKIKKFKTSGKNS